MQLKRVWSTLPCQHNTRGAHECNTATSVMVGMWGGSRGGQFLKDAKTLFNRKGNTSTVSSLKKKKKKSTEFGSSQSTFAGLEPSIFPPRSLSDTFGLLYMKIREQRYLSVTEPTQSAPSGSSQQPFSDNFWWRPFSKNKKKTLHWTHTMSKVCRFTDGTRADRKITPSVTLLKGYHKIF